MYPEGTFCLSFFVPVLYVQSSFKIESILLSPTLSIKLKARIVRKLFISWLIDEYKYMID